MLTSACPRLGVAILSLSLAASASGQQTSFRGLGFMKGNERASAAMALSRDAACVAGWCDLDAVTWTEAGVQGLGRLPAPFDGLAVASGASSDGRMVVGFGRGASLSSAYWAFVWRDGQVYPMGPRPAEGSFYGSYASSISADGMVIAGSSDEGAGFPRAFVWMPGMDWEPISSSPSSAAAVSADGTTVGGVMNAKGVDVGFVWTPAGGARALRDLPGGLESAVVYALSDDGSIAVGGSVSGASEPEYAYEAVRWLPSGDAQPLGDLPGGDYSSEARAVSGDGSVVVGSSSVDHSSVSAAFIWDETHGMRDLRDVLVSEHGLDLAGWRLTAAQGISANGRTIVGRGINPSGEFEGWMVTLGRACAADWNDDGVVEFADLLDFLDSFFCDGDIQGCASADFNSDGAVDSRDFFEFLVAFFAGCAG